MSQFFHGRVHRVDRGARQRFSHIPHPAADDIARRVWMALAKLPHPAADLGKEIAGLELEIILVQECHGRSARVGLIAAVRPKNLVTKPPYDCS